MACQRLLHEYFEKDSLLRKKLIAGLPDRWMDTERMNLTIFPVCDSASQTACVICWNSREWGMKTDKYWGTNLECVNPLTWKSDTLQAPVSINLGSVPYGFKRIDKGIADAKISPTGLLWVHKKNKRGTDAFLTITYLIIIFSG